MPFDNATVNSRQLNDELQQLFDSLPALIFYKDTANRVLRVNVTFALAMGSRREVLEGRSCQELWPEHAAVYWASDEEVIRTGRPKRNVVEPLATPQGIRWIQTDRIPMKDDGGVVVGVLNFAVDITEKKATEDALKAEKERLEFALTGANLGAWDWYPATGFVTFSPSWAGLFGFDANDVWPHVDFYLKLIHPDDREMVERRLEDHLTGRTSFYESEHRMLKKNGQLIWTYDRGRVAERDKDGRPARVSGVIRDISEQKRVERALLQTEQKYYGLYENAPDMFLTVSLPEGRVQQCNRMLAEKLGGDKWRLLGGTIWDWLDENDRGAVRRLFARLADEGVVRNAELTVRGGLFGDFAVLMSAVAAKDESGALSVAHVSWRDITDKREAEKQLRELIELKEAFTSLVSHELRTPLGPIREGAGIILDGLAGPINEEQRELLEMVTRNADRLRRLINDVLDFQKMTSGRMHYLFGLHDLNDTVREVVEMVRLSAEKQGLTITAEPDAALTPFAFDRDRLVQVITNLLGNAVKFTDEGGITVLTSAEGDNARITVKDTGSGVAPEEMPRLFQSFAQLARNRRRGQGGTGLGLAICREIVQAHGGRIWAESPGVNQGTSFQILLPRRTVAAATGAESAAVVVTVAPGSRMKGA